MLTDTLFQVLFNTPIPRILLKSEENSWIVIQENEAFKHAIAALATASTGKQLWEVLEVKNINADDLILLKEAFLQSAEHKITMTLPDFKYSIEEHICFWDLEIRPVGLENNPGEYLLLTITDHKDLKYLAEKQRLRFSDIIKHIPAGLCIVSGKEMVLEVANDVMLKHWDRTDAVLGMPLLKFLPEITDQVFPKLLEEVYTTGNSFSNKGAVARLMVGGSLQTVYVDFAYIPLKNSEGIIDSILVMSQDVTDRVLGVQREQELTEELMVTNEELLASNEELAAMNEELALSQASIRLHNQNLAESEARFRNMVKLAPVAIGVLTGQDFVLESANDRMLSFWAKTAHIIGKPLAIALPEIEEQGFIKILNKVYTSGKIYHGNEEKVSIERNGDLVDGYFTFIFQPIKDADEQVTGIMIVAVEVTDQVRSRQLAEEREKQFRFLLNAIPQQVWTADADGQLDYVNQVVCDDFGYDLPFIISHGWGEFIHPDDLSSCQEKWLHALHTGSEYITEFRLRFRDGRYKWHLAKAVPLIENDRIKLWIGTNTNINLQKNNEQKKDEFISIASHELKTPLTSIKAFNQLMQRKNSEHNLDGFIDKSAQNISRLERLIKDLLDVTKINAGKITYEVRPFNFKRMLEESIESVQLTSPDHEIILESTEDVIFSGDQYRLEQVVHNFLTNAVKYSPEGKKVIVRLIVKNNDMIVSFQDFGIGIAEKDRKRLFERYYRVDDISMRFEGLGLGLFISSEILRRHEGNFWIESEPGEGSTFYFRLPVSR